MTETERRREEMSSSGEEVENRSVVSLIKKTIIIIGSSLLILTAMRNSLLWHLQRFWGASGDFFEAQYLKVYNYYEGDDFGIVVHATYFGGIFTFILANALLTSADYFGRPAAFKRYKIQPGENDPVGRPKFWKCVALCSFNLLIVAYPFLSAYHYLFKKRGCSAAPELPTFQWVLMELVVFVLVEEVGFYYSHRLFHHPRLYKYVHKIHHEWTAPISITSIYAHPLEHVISNLSPVVAGTLFMGSHVATMWLWFLMALLNTTLSHGGYHFPVLQSPESHDFHHLKFTNCFGVLGVLDALHGTDLNFKRSPRYKYNVTYFSLTPPWEADEQMERKRMQ